ncbi:hypothetical protein JTE90_016468 [Oedothorax gibbosus]|uniref:Uncharacterized protein n=1 Tax=Oedothorax gibbosus TaxID=931172 RepID=A0AAV6V7P9_9ARAC|nr:hypothetical protein JTE90_016468 [Oedothorax gibbosus]
MISAQVVSWMEWEIGVGLSSPKFVYCGRDVNFRNRRKVGGCHSNQLPLEIGKWYSLMVVFPASIAGYHINDSMFVIRSALIQHVAILNERDFSCSIKRTT